MIQFNTRVLKNKRKSVKLRFANYAVCKGDSYRFFVGLYTKNKAYLMYIGK